MPADFDHQLIIEQVEQWLVNAVIGLNLCPFAAKPYKNKQIRITVCAETEQSELLSAIEQEFRLLEQTPATEIETTLFVIANALEHFDDYWQFVDWVEFLIEKADWQGVFQVASFHPHYQFAGTEPADAENLTNRAPYPIIHLLREPQMEKAIAHYPNPEQIPENNIEKMQHLSVEEKQRIFAYLDHK